MNKPNITAARDAAQRLLGEIETLAFTPPEGAHDAQRRAADTVNALAAALGLEGAVPAPAPVPPASAEIRSTSTGLVDRAEARRGRGVVSLDPVMKALLTRVHAACVKAVVALPVLPEKDTSESWGRVDLAWSRAVIRELGAAVRDIDARVRGEASVDESPGDISVFDLAQRVVDGRHVSAQGVLEIAQAITRVGNVLAANGCDCDDDVRPEDITEVVEDESDLCLAHQIERAARGIR